MKHPAGMIFDIGGVILDFDHMLICKRLASVCALSPGEIYLRIFTGGIEAGYDTGALSTAEFTESVSKAISAPLSIAGLGEIWCDIFSEKTEVIEIIRGLSGKTRLMLLSNTNELHFEYARKKFPALDTLFEKQFLSYKLGLRKPDPAIYKKAVELSGLPAKELFYIDDRQDYVTASINAGLNAAPFTGAKDLKALLKKLDFSL